MAAGLAPFSKGMITVLNGCVLVDGELYSYLENFVANVGKSYWRKIVGINTYYDVIL